MAPTNHNNKARKYKKNDSKLNNRKNHHSKKAQTQSRHFGCGICKADHRLVKCKKFLNLNLEKRYKTVAQLHYCSNCLARNHLLDKCENKTRCNVCGLKHHTILHGHKKILKNLQVRKPNPHTTSGNSKTSKVRSNAIKTNQLPTSLNKVFVPTAEVHIMTDDGCVTTRAIINPSSTTSRVASSFVRDYKLKTFDLDGVTYVKITLTPNMSSITKYDLYVMVCTELPRKPYSLSAKESVKQKFEHLALADPNFISNDYVELELGGDIYSSILKSNIIHIDGGSLIAQDTALGWVIMGPYTG